MSEGDWAWIALLIGIVLYDGWAALSKRETLSMAFYEAVRHPRRRWPVIAAWGYLTAHLFHLIPDGFDPLRGFS